MTNEIKRFINNECEEYKAENEATLQFGYLKDATETDKRRVDFFNDLLAKGFHGCGLGTDEPFFFRQIARQISVEVITNWERKTADVNVFINGIKNSFRYAF